MRRVGLEKVLVIKLLVVIWGRELLKLLGIIGRFGYLLFIIEFFILGLGRLVFIEKRELWSKSLM